MEQHKQVFCILLVAFHIVPSCFSSYIVTLLWECCGMSGAAWAYLAFFLFVSSSSCLAPFFFSHAFKLLLLLHQAWLERHWQRS